MTLVLFFKKHAEERAEFCGSVPIASSSATSAVGGAKFYSRSQDAVIRVYDDITAAIPRRVFGKRDRSAEGPKADRALKVLA